MANKKKGSANVQKNLPVQLKDAGITKAGWKVIAAGVVLLICGYFILTKTDPQGQNWASNVSPFLILGGYMTIAVGIIIPEKKINTPA
jgi:hypothetical protein